MVRVPLNTKLRGHPNTCYYVIKLLLIIEPVLTTTKMSLHLRLNAVARNLRHHNARHRLNHFRNCPHLYPTACVVVVSSGAVSIPTGHPAQVRK